jgi:hypothetical protein
MTDPLKVLLDAGAVPTTSFPPTSRYAEIGITAWDPSTGAPPIAYLRRRLCPLPSRFALLFEAQVTEADRRDLIASRHLGEVELWWQLADANGAIDPRELTHEIGSVIRITLPADVPGATDG